MRAFNRSPEPDTVWSWLPILIASWLPAAAPPDSPERPALVPIAPPIAIEHELTTLWVEGDARAVLAEAGPTVATSAALSCGEPLPPGALVEVPERGRVVWLSGDLRVLTAYGPATHRWDGDVLATLAGAAPRVSVVPGYREGPNTPLPAVATTAPDDDEDPNVGLTFVAPVATVLRDVAPVLRWRWAEADARFDLTLERVESDAEAVIIERWRSLAGRSLVLWRPLERGARYRAVISLHGARALARVVSDQVEFDVLDAAGEAALDDALAALRAAGRGAPPRPELEVLRARVFESYGLLADAERAWAALALLYPGRPELNAQARRLARAAAAR